MSNLLNKDILLYLSSFLSLEKLCIMKSVCKEFNQWLSDPSGVAWSQRIESSFPLSHPYILSEHVEEQISKLLIFDGFVHEGHRVSYFDLSRDGEEPVNTYLFPPFLDGLVVLGGTTVVRLFDYLRGQIVFRMSVDGSEFEDEAYIQLFQDLQERVIGVYAGEGTSLHLYSVDGNNEMNHIQDYHSDLTYSCWQNLFGDRGLILDSSVHGGISALKWTSLSSDRITTTIDIKAHCGRSSFEQTVYLAQTLNENRQLVIQKVNCLQQYETMQTLYIEDIGEESTGLMSVHLFDSPKRRVLHLYLLGSTNNTVLIFDVVTNKIIDRILVPRLDSPIEFESIKYNPNNGCYSAQRRGPDPEFVVIRSGANLDAHATDVQADLFTRGKVVFQHKCQLHNLHYKWLNDDILVFRTFKDSFYVQQEHYFSLKLRRLVGSIKANIVHSTTHGEDVILAFDEEHGLYRISLDPYFL